jgi:hypothetical protein
MERPKNQINPKTATTLKQFVNDEDIDVYEQY